MKFLGMKLLVLFLVFASMAQAADEYTLDPNHTFVVWRISHFGFSYPTGKWMAEGTLNLDEAKPEQSKLNVIIHVGGILTGIPKLDNHLKSEDFFDVAKYPRAIFISDSVKRINENKAKVHGILTLHGVSKPVILDVVLNKIAISPITQKKTAGFTATTQLNRSDFGIIKYLPGLGNNVTIHIEAEAYKQ